MSVIVFTGSHKGYDNDLHDGLMGITIERLRDSGPTVFISGAQYGVDTRAAEIAYELFPEAKHIVVVPAKRHNKTFVKDFEKCRNVGIVVMPPDTDYRDRNQEMVTLARQASMLGGAGPIQVMAFSIGPLSKRSGTSMTINIAKKDGIQNINLVELPK
jgi:hypothetical protein